MSTPEHLMCHSGTLHYIAQTGAVDAAGDLVVTETTATTKFWLFQTGESEQTALANTQTADADLWLPASTTPDGLSHLVGLGKTWELLGPPLAAYNARTGTQTHWEAKVRAAA